MVELFSTTAVAMAGLSMGLIVGSALAGRTSAKKTPLSQGGVDAASNNGLSPGDSAAVCQGLPTTKSITTRPVLQEHARAIGIDRWPYCPEFASMVVDQLIQGSEDLYAALREELN